MTGKGSVVGRAEGVPRHFAPTEGAYFSFNRLVWYDGLGSPVRATDTLFGYEYVYHFNPNGTYMGGSLPYGRHIKAAVRGSDVNVTDQTRFEIRRYAADGILGMILRIHTAPTVVDDAVRHGILPEARDAAWAFPDTLPALGDIRLDPDGRLWVQDYLSGLEREDQKW